MFTQSFKGLIRKIRVQLYPNLIHNNTDWTQSHASSRISIPIHPVSSSARQKPVLEGWEIFQNWGGRCWAPPVTPVCFVSHTISPLDMTCSFPLFRCHQRILSSLYQLESHTLAANYNKVYLWSSKQITEGKSWMFYYHSFNKRGFDYL